MLKNFVATSVPASVSCFVRVSTLVLLLLGLTSLTKTMAGVVINEIFYNAPDDQDNLQWVELYNPRDEASSIAGWTLDKGKLFTFPPGTIVPQRLCSSRAQPGRGFQGVQRDSPRAPEASPSARRRASRAS
jgi:hypothetical protein